MGRDARPNLPLWAWDSTNGEPWSIEAANADASASLRPLAEAARRTKQHAIRYAARYLGDGLQGEEILEDVLRSAAGAASRGRIEKPERYLLKGVVRRVRELLSRKPLIEYVGSVADLDALKQGRSENWVEEFERHLLIEETIALMDHETRGILFRRARRDDWNKIGAELGISAHAAEQRFRYGLEKVRAKILGSSAVKDSSTREHRNKKTGGPSWPNHA